LLKATVIAYRPDVGIVDFPREKPQSVD